MPSWMLFLCIETLFLKIDFFQIWTWWPFVTLTMILTSDDAQYAFSVHRSSKIYFLITLTCHDAQNAVSVHRNSKIDIWKFALDDHWLPWPDFDLPWWTKCFFCLKNLFHLIYFSKNGLYAMTCECFPPSMHRYSPPCSCVQSMNQWGRFSVLTGCRITYVVLILVIDL